ncbi:MAG: class I SAM-dependent methyltransferase [Erysipelotrichaceae bacterium]|nr:class I SAM-dependent methyltransferase [Erysipelotrichaceae bacterium]
MKADYRNWMPLGMIYSGFGALSLSLVLYVVCMLFKADVLSNVFLIITVAAAAVTLWMLAMYRNFSYEGKRQLQKKIIDTVAAYAVLPKGGRGLDVGCGSGALTVACAKRNPEAHFTGIDRWGKEYASFSLKLCEDNAGAEGVKNVSFIKGDAKKLDLEDETFDFVTSNYVYHNISVKDRQKLLLETLRTLKKGGSFAVHDIFSRAKYGDMDAFMKRLKDVGYEDVRLVSTTNNDPITPFEAFWMGLSGSAVLYGRK